MQVGRSQHFGRGAWLAMHPERHEGIQVLLKECHLFVGPHLMSL